MPFLRNTSLPWLMPFLWHTSLLWHTPLLWQKSSLTHVPLRYMSLVWHTSFLWHTSETEVPSVQTPSVKLGSLSKPNLTVREHWRCGVCVQTEEHGVSYDHIHIELCDLRICLNELFSSELCQPAPPKLVSPLFLNARSIQFRWCFRTNIFSELLINKSTIWLICE